MLRIWTKVLPFFIVAAYAKKYSERFSDKDGVFVYPYNGVKIYLEKR